MTGEKGQPRRYSVSKGKMPFVGSEAAFKKGFLENGVGRRREVVHGGEELAGREGE